MDNPFPCKDCITFSICNSSLNEIPESHEIYGLWLLAKKCSILDNFIGPEFYNFDYLHKVLKLFKNGDDDE